MKDANITTVSIPKPLAEKIKNRIKGTGFNSVSSYVTYILREVMSSLEQKDKRVVFGRIIVGFVDRTIISGYIFLVRFPG